MITCAGALVKSVHKSNAASSKKRKNLSYWWIEDIVIDDVLIKTNLNCLFIVHISHNES